MISKILKRVTRAAFNTVGLDIRRMAPPVIGRTPDIPHEKIWSNATYAPWLADHRFTEIYNMVSQHTLVDRYRCYELWTLAGRIRHLPGDAIEIGVWRGGTGCLIAKRIQSLDPNRTVYLCDTFSGVVAAGEKDTRYRGGEHADTSIEIVEGLISKMTIQNVRVLQGVFPEETSEQMTSLQLALVHIDVDVYKSALQCFEYTWPKVVIGGVVVFDDYGQHGCEGVTRMVNELDLSEALVIYNLNGHAIVVKCAHRLQPGLSACSQ
jgi:O-methyltransferase